MFKYNNRIFIVFLSIFLFLTNSAISSSYGYWDKSNDVQNEILPIGSWTFALNPITGQVAIDLSNYIDGILSTDPNNDLQYIYLQDGNLSNVVTTIENIAFYNYTWDITGTGTATPAETLGFISLVDRSTDGFSNPLHDILPAYTTTPPFPEYSYFKAYDALNNITNNLYSLRLNYGVTITTDQPIANMSEVSFYAARGLIAPNDTLTMASDRTFEVSISTDGINWVLLGSDTPVNATTDSLAFSFYSYPIPSQFLNQNLYLRILYNGEAIKQGNNRSFSRLIIDDLVVTTE